MRWWEKALLAVVGISWKQLNVEEIICTARPITIDGKEHMVMTTPRELTSDEIELLRKVWTSRYGRKE